ncbi:MAG: hypothetical protein Fur0037_04880 [Planctomycetota bacterium]
MFGKLLGRLFLPFSILSCLVAQSSQQAVVPPANATLDGSDQFFVAGTVEARRHLTLIDGSLLSSIANHTLTALAFRRDASQNAYAGGIANLTVKLSHAARSWDRASAAFAANHGPDLTTVFSGPISIPASPPASGPNVPWTPANTLAIPFQTPFLYLGGTLAVEVSGAPDPAHQVPSWPADAVWEPTGGTAQSVGSGCGAFGGPNGEWSFVTATNFVPGGTAGFMAIGSPYDLGCWILAANAQAGAVDLSPFGAPGCYGNVQGMLGSALLFFSPPILPQRPADGGIAIVELQLPATSTFLGASLASQWLRLGAGGLTSSNAHQWTIALSMPALPVTLVSAPVVSGEPVTGRVTPGCGHVMRFDLL